MSSEPRVPSVREIVGRCLELPPADREAFIDRMCGEDPALARRVRRLVAAAERADDSGFLEPQTIVQALVEREAPGPALDASGLIGRRIGRYLVQRVIGTGGMGSVYEAVQDEPRRTVALKVMRGGLFARSAQRRFEYEAAILARLRHPCIAQVYDAGTQSIAVGSESQTIRYFAMELVPDARPLTAYATTHRLSVEARLRLFELVCDAVHHGHQKGIIHRDLKPGNILVDDSGHVKVIDFGVARATDNPDATQHTIAGQMVGTLQYMSPEQCGVESADLDIRSDVYSLGLVLYELLCDKPPYDVANVPLHEAARIIREEPPARPGHASREMRGDLETITLKALEKDRERRYESAAALREDIQRFLRGDAISARPATLMYQLRMLARRNRHVVAAALGIVLAMLIALVSSVYWLNRVKRERDAARDAQTKANVAARRSDRAAEFLKAVVASASPNLPIRSAAQFSPDPLEVFEEPSQVFVGSRPDQFTVPDVLVAAGKRLESEFPDEPLVRADLAETLALTLHQLGFFNPAADLYESCRTTREKLLGPEDPLTLRVTARCAEIIANIGDARPAVPLAQQVYERTRRVYGAADRRTLLARYQYLMIHLQAGAPLDQTLDDLSRLHQDACDIFGKGDPLALRLESALGYNLFVAGKRFEGENMVRSAVTALAESAGAHSLATIQASLAYADMLAADQRLSEAESVARDGLEGLQAVYPDASARVRSAQTLLVGILRRQKRFDEAIEIARKMLTVARRVEGVEHHLTIRYEDVLSRLLVRAAEASGYVTPTSSGASAHSPDVSLAMPTGSASRIRVRPVTPELSTLNFPAEAEQLAEHAARVGERVLTLRDGNALNYALNHIATVRWRGRSHEARQLLIELESRCDALGITLSSSPSPIYLLIRGDIRTDLGEYVEAEPDLRAAYDQLQGLSPEYRTRCARSLARLLDLAGRPDEAARFHGESK